MAITAIARNWDYAPGSVGVVTTDDLTAITTPGYLTDEADNIALLNNGAFEWMDTDFVYIAYDGGQGSFVRDAGDECFVALPASGGLSDTLPSGDIFVGSASNIATGVTMSGDATMANTGAITIASGAVTSAKLASSTIQYARVSLSAAQWNGMYATPVQVVAAAGANTQIMVHAAIASMTFVAAQYAAGGVVKLQYTNTINGGGTAATGTVAAATVNGLAASSAFTLQGAQAAAAFTAVRNQGVFISNDTAAFTTGDGTWVIDIWYSVKPA